MGKTPKALSAACGTVLAMTGAGQAETPIPYNVQSRVAEAIVEEASVRACPRHFAYLSGKSVERAKFFRLAEEVFGRTEIKQVIDKRVRELQAGSCDEYAAQAPGWNYTFIRQTPVGDRP